ncbi:unnamed protein product, partial [Polarella glacialis]
AGSYSLLAEDVWGFGASNKSAFWAKAELRKPRARVAEAEAAMTLREHILARQRCEDQKKTAPDPGEDAAQESRAASSDGGRPLATPFARVGRKRPGRGACEECGWHPTGGLCACGFLEMDPFRPVAEVVALTKLQAAALGAASAEVELEAWPSLVEGESLELRMSQLGEPRKHAWPRSLTVHLGDTQVARFDPPREGCKRSDSPFEVPLPQVLSGPLR